MKKIGISDEEFATWEAYNAAATKRIAADMHGSFGWLRLSDILQESKQDELIIADRGASEFLAYMTDLVDDMILLNNGISKEDALRPFENEVQSKAQAGLRKGPAASGKIRSENSRTYHAQWRQWAANYLKVHPHDDMEKVAEEVAELAKRGGHAMANRKPYSLSYIYDALKGLKKELKSKPQE